ncbi:MAG: 1-(5-phosphoribosyl)-5-[(5-phosphoribosylamino)methylideneamino]imidazole-4-carboxamide isomerase [Verrucomicrobiota bacterium]
MILLPAIDLMSGQVVRLRQGKAEEKTVYSDDPVAFAQEWQAKGGDYLHVVDLDGAFEGTSKNLEAVRNICQALTIPVELGGGLRDLKAIETILNTGVSRGIIGSKACQDPAFVEQAVKVFGGERVAVGIDARDGKVATKGWVELSQWNAKDLALKMQDLGVQTIIYTDIATDGMLTGPNFDALQEMNDALEINLVASGGVSDRSDIERLNEMEDLYGVIIGKALYENRIRLEECRLITR